MNHRGDDFDVVRAAESTPARILADRWGLSLRRTQEIIARARERVTIGGVQAAQAPREREVDNVVLFPDLHAPAIDWIDTLQRHGTLAEVRRREDPRQRQGVIDLSHHRGPVGIMQMSDVHIGSPQCDVDALIHHLELLKTTPNLYAILAGDLTEWAISPRMLDAVLSQIASPQEQLRVFQAMLHDLREKVIALVTGNHDERGFRMAGVDVFEFIATSVRDRGIYLRDGGVLRIRLAEAEYTWRVAHGDGMRGGSMYSNTAAMARNARHEVGWTDVASSGHTHDPEVKIVFEPRSDGRPKAPSILLRSGTYKIIGDEQYPDRMGYWQQPFVAMPAVVFFPNEKRMIPFFRVEDAVEVLRLYDDHKEA